MIFIRNLFNQREILLIVSNNFLKEGKLVRIKL